MSISSLLPWALAVLLLAGAILNLSAPASVRRRYARLGYGQRLRYLVAGLELAASGLLAFPATRPIGAALAIAILSAIRGHHTKVRSAYANKERKLNDDG